MSGMRMFALQEVRRTYQERGVQRVWEKIIGMHVQMKLKTAIINHGVHGG